MFEQIAAAAKLVEEVKKTDTVERTAMRGCYIAGAFAGAYFMHQVQESRKCLHPGDFDFEIIEKVRQRIRLHKLRNAGTGVLDPFTYLK